MAERLNQPIRVAKHFVERLHERFPRMRWTEGMLANELAQAEWYPARGEDAFYAVRRLGDCVMVLVVRVKRGLVDLVTVYEPRPGWERRLLASRPWPMSLVLAAAP